MMPLTGWSSFLDRYGIPVVILGVLVWSIYKLFWPALLRQIDDTRKVLVNQLDEAQKRLDKQTTEFLAALDRRDRIMEQGFAKLDDRLSARRRMQSSKKRPRKQ